MVFSINKYVKMKNKIELKNFLKIMIHILFHFRKKTKIIKNINFNKMHLKHKKFKNRNDLSLKENKYYYKSFVNNL